MRQHGPARRPGACLGHREVRPGDAGVPGGSRLTHPCVLAEAAQVANDSPQSLIGRPIGDDLQSSSHQAE